jgi:Mn2+/Fe2+ NRAMP family transporter
MTEAKARSFFDRIGPGLLYAAGAVGISHLVQSTRAGGDYGFGLWWIIILIALIKYPGIRFGGDYAIATGKTLIHSYVTIGRWVGWLYAGVTVLTMAFVGAALTLVVNGLLKAVLGIDLSDLVIAIIVLLLTGLFMLSGKYRALEALNKVLVPLFTVLILFVTIMLVIRIDWGVTSMSLPSMDGAMLVYIVALAGWLLTPMDGSVLQSVWTCAKSRQLGYRVSREESQLDFNIGYGVSLVLALCFMTMGAGVLFGSGVEVAGGSGGFAAQIIGLFSSVIGEWSFLLVGATALLVIYSTLTTVLDGYSRNLATITDIIVGKEMSRTYEYCLVAMVVGSILVIGFFMRSFTTVIDFTGILIFVLGPFYAVLNHRAMFGGEIAEEYRPGEGMRWWSIIGIIVMSLVALAYIYLRWLA